MPIHTQAMGAVRDRGARAKAAVGRDRKSNDAPRSAANKPIRKVGRPRKLKPAPPVFDCQKCQVVADLRCTVRELESAERARTIADLNGIPVTMDSVAIQRVLDEALHPNLAEIAAVPGKIALGTITGDRLRAAAWCVERAAGKVVDKHEHRHSFVVDLVSATDEELDLLERAQHVIARLSGKVVV